MHALFLCKSAVNQLAAEPIFVSSLERLGQHNAVDIQALRGLKYALLTAVVAEAN